MRKPLPRAVVGVAVISVAALLIGGGCGGYSGYDAEEDFRQFEEQARQEEDYAARVESHLIAVGATQPWGDYVEEVSWGSGFAPEVFTSIPPEVLERTAEVDTYAAAICEAALTVPERNFSNVEVYAEDEETLLASCALGSPTVVSSDPMPVEQVESGRAFVQYLRETYSTQPWFASYVATIVGPPDVRIEADADAADLCEAALSAPGVRSVVIVDYYNGSTLMRCQSGSS